MNSQLSNWAARDGRGRSISAGTAYVLPSGASRAPYASWVSKNNLAGLRSDAKRTRLVPDFIVEIMSASDRLPAAQIKMEEWIDAGVALGWLLDPNHRTAYIYRPGQPAEKLEALKKLKGEGPVDGFVLQLAEIWDPDL